jgi:chromosome segregation ATPase
LKNNNTRKLETINPNSRGKARLGSKSLSQDYSQEANYFLKINNNLKSNLYQAQKQNKALIKDKSFIQEQHNDLMTNINNLCSIRVKLRNLHIEAKNEIEDLTKKTNDLEEQITECDKDINKQGEILRKLNQEYNDLKGKNDDLNEDFRKLDRNYRSKTHDKKN